MPVHELYPAVVKYNYQSPFGLHVMTLPTREWLDTRPSDAFGSYDDWDSNFVDAESFWDTFASEMTVEFTDDIFITSWEIWTYATPGGPAQFRVSKAITEQGAFVSTNPFKAVQETYNFLDTEGLAVKLTFMDAVARDFDKATQYAVLAGGEQDLVDRFTGTDGVFSSRAGNRPATFRSRTTTINEKLRREYHMG
jgi:hypothetical protein